MWGVVCKKLKKKSIDLPNYNFILVESKGVLRMVRFHISYQLHSVLQWDCKTFPLLDDMDGGKIRISRTGRSKSHKWSWKRATFEKMQKAMALNAYFIIR